MNELKWAVLGTGVIANEMAQALHNMGRTLYGVCNRTNDKAVSFAEKYHVEKVYTSYNEMYEDSSVNVIYITPPHNTHYEFIRQSLLHGKLVLAEAMTIWHMPLYKKLWQIVESGQIGRPQMITMNFGSFKDYDMTNRFFNISLAGGAMLDIGVYALSIVRSFMCESPDQILSQMKPAPTGCDEQASILLMNPSGQMATVALSMHSKQPKRAMISCEKAYIEIMEYPRADHAVIVDAETGKQTIIEAGRTSNALQYELEDMETAILTGNTAIMKLRESSDVMDIMTKLRSDWGLFYPEEIHS